MQALRTHSLSVWHRSLLTALLFCTFVTCQAEILPGPLAVLVNSDANKPIGGVTVHVGGRKAVSSPAGQIVFDGIPQGQYDLWCEHPSYQAFKEKINLPNGERAIQQIKLHSEVLSPLQWQLTEEITGEPVVQATIHLTPKAVQAALSGPLVFSPNHTGHVKTIPVPEGTYQLQITAPGFETINQVFDHRKSEAPVQLKFKALANDITYNVSVKAQDGSSISQANVTLWEVYLLGEIANHQTNAQGQVTFSHLKTGTMNPVDPNNLLRVTHRSNIVIRVEANGYITTEKSVRLTHNGQCTLTLAPDVQILEQEPNDDKGSALPIALGQGLSFKINKPRDQDWFKFSLAEATRITLSTEGCPVQLTMQLFNSAGDQVGSQNSYRNSKYSTDWNLHEGHYYLVAREWSSNYGSEELNVFKLTGQIAADPLEANNTISTARPLEMGQHMRGLIFPVKDIDYYSLHLDRPSCLRLETCNTPNIERSVNLLNASGKSLGTLNLYARSMSAREWHLPPGDYYVSVQEWGNNHCSLDPYDFRFVVMTDDGIDDPPLIPDSRIMSVRHLSLNARTFASIAPLGDRDVFTLNIPSKGTLHIQQFGPTELTTRILNAQGKTLASRSTYARSKSHTALGLTQPCTLYLDVMEWGNNGWSPLPYELQTWFDPAGEIERLQPNETAKTAAPLELGAMVRDNILPRGDQDWYQFFVDQPGSLRIWHHAPTEFSVTLYNAKNEIKGNMNTYARSVRQFDCPVIPGLHRLHVREWNNNDEAAHDYALKVTLNRAVPGETPDLKASPIIPLKLSEAQPCGFEHVGDVERFRISIPAKGEYAYWMGGPLETSTLAIDTRTGNTLFQRNRYAGGSSAVNFTTEGPIELLLTVNEWNNNNASMIPNWIMVSPKTGTLASASASYTVNPIKPTEVTFSTAPIRGIQSMPQISLDINGDNQPDVTLSKDNPQTWSFPKQGLYKVTAMGKKETVSARSEFWVQATGQPVREGIHVMIATPGEGELITQNNPLLATALSYEGKPIRQVTLQVDGQTLGTDYTLPYEFEVPWTSLAGSDTLLKVTAMDTAGKQATMERAVHVTDYFNLLPAENTVVTGNDVVISWDGGSFGQAKVRYRLKGDGKTEAPWQDVIGQNSRSRRVRLTALEPDKVYEFQPLGGSEPGSIRQVTRIRGLAFTEAHYGGSILRDYDQKLPVGVRNHATEPRIVRLRCDQPKDSLLLVEFIGDGEKGRPVELGPGEQRIFTLGFSAQDVVKAQHSLPIYIQSDDGYSDQSDVEVHVKLPHVDLEWVDITPEDETGLGRTYELINRGDTLTDLNVTSVEDQINIQPEVTHGLLQSGQRERFEVHPKLYDGFTACKDQLTATSIGKTFSVDYVGALKPGESLYRLNMTAGLDPVTGEPNNIPEAMRAARRLVGQYLSGSTVDWAAGTDPQDTNGDGKPDRWTVLDELNQTEWYGRDTEGDGQVDFAQADVGLDGEIDHSSLLENGQWHNTNLLDAWLEMNFSIPKNRHKYQPHDLDLVVNGQIAGQLKQTLPEGNYRFGLSPSALAWSEDGIAGENELEINSRFLNFAHYVISSDFQLKTRLLGTDTFMVGTSREDAIQRLYDSDPGFSTDAPDFSLSSEDIQITPTQGIEKGMPVTLTGTVRNLGTGMCDELEIGLFLAVPGTDGQEMERLSIAPPGMMTDKTFKFVWAAAPGNHSLRIVVDPDNHLEESNRKNNVAITNLVVPGDDAKPTLTVIHPKDKLVSEEGQIHLLATAQDDTGIIGIEVFVDNAAAQPLYRTDEGFAGHTQLQPGSHQLRFRATDSGNQHVEETRSVTIEATPPVCSIKSPVDGANIDDDNTWVTASAPKAQQVAVRVNNGPWFGLESNESSWVGKVDLPFGKCNLEVVAVDEAGMRQTQEINVTCTAQPEEPEEKEDKPVEDPNDTTDKQTEDKGKPQGKDTPEKHANQGTQDKKNSAKAQTPKNNTTDQNNKPKAQKPQTAGGNNPKAGGKNTPPSGNTGNTQGQGKRTPQADSNTDHQKKDNSDTPEGTQGKTPQAPETVQPEPIDIPDPGTILPPVGVQPRARRAPSPPSRARAPRSRGRGAPSGFAYNRQRNDWYCPNRPNIKIKFKLPEWLTKEKFNKILAKGPNSKEFKALESKLLAGYWYKNFGKKIKGQTMDKLLLKYKEMLLKRCGRLDQADGKLPSFLQSLGFAANDPPSDPKELAAWRNKMKELTEVYWLRLLATEDPSTVLKGMKQRAEALGKFDEASQMAAEAVMQEIEANQKITQDVLEALPFTGEALDVLAAVTGESLSGEKLGPWERFFRAACVAGPVALEEGLKRSPRMQEALGQFIKATGEMSTNMKNSLLTKLGMNIDKFDEMAEATGKFLTKERHIFAKKADDTLATAKNAFKQTEEGMEDLLQMKRAKEASKKTIDELDDLVKKGGKAGDTNMEDTLMRMQKDKSAQSLMNSADVPPEVRKKANETIKNIYKDTDVPTMNRIKNSDDVKKFAKDHGLDPDSIEVTVWNPTNTKGPRPGQPGYVDPDYVKFGRDRDVTYQIKGKNAEGRPVTLDVNHEISGPIYQDEFFKRCNGRPPVDAAEAKKFAADMDQMVTSKWHREAYNSGPDVSIDDWLNNDITPPVARPEDIRDTMITKSTHWFREAEKTGRNTVKYSNDMAEGMRQASKQWDNFIAKRAAQYGADVPVQLEKAMDLFKKVQNGSVTPKQAEKMLEKLGKLGGGVPMTPQKAVENMAHYFEAIEKGPGKAFRSIKTKNLADALDSVSDVGRKSDMITEAYRSGHISGETYRKMRQGSFKLPPNPTPAQKEQLKTWAFSAWHRRGISLTEKKAIEDQVGPLE